MGHFLRKRSPPLYKTCTRHVRGMYEPRTRFDLAKTSNIKNVYGNRAEGETLGVPKWRGYSEMEMLTSAVPPGSSRRHYQAESRSRLALGWSPEGLLASLFVLQSPPGL
jgi:hypothetical protein